MVGRGGGRGKFRRERDPWHEDRAHYPAHGGISPPSRHLWVGGMGPRVTLNLLHDKFLRFGELENVAFVPGRSFAFVNFMREDDAVIALRSLQGMILDGSPLRIEFAKGDKSPGSSSYNENFSQENEDGHLIKPGDSFSLEDSRLSRPSPERSPHGTFKRSRSAEPSEMLWVGFPTYLNVDDMALRRAFTPFGEIKKITRVAGRNYAFVRYATTESACRAKEALDMKLFDNPRVHVRFARSDTNLVEHGSSSNDERSFDRTYAEFSTASPRPYSKFDRISGDSGSFDFGRSSSFRAGRELNIGDTFESTRFQDFVSRSKMSEDAFEHERDSPATRRDVRLQRSPFFEDSWGVRGGTSGKKLKADPFPDKELPEYHPFTDYEKQKLHEHLPKAFPLSNLDSGQLSFKGFVDDRREPLYLDVESGDPWKISDPYSTDHGLLSQLQRFNSGFRQPPPSKEWKWAGTIAKGGTPVCRAKCLPVGKVLDFMLPDVVDCTARTGLDMLAKHYYQAAKSWVVFFVPESDADMSYYNEFMHYMGEKQRAAVAKLGEKTTLFLVPPSEFSEKVLKVPGKMSISGVILKFEQPCSNSGSVSYPPVLVESGLQPSMSATMDSVKSQDVASIQRPRSPIYPSSSPVKNYFGSLAEDLAPAPPFQRLQDTYRYPGSTHLSGKVADFRDQRTLAQTNWSAHVPHSGVGALPLPPPPPSGHSQMFGDTVAEKYPMPGLRFPEGANPSNFNPGFSGPAPLPPIEAPSLRPLQPAQLAQLVALLGQKPGNDQGSGQAEMRSNLPGNPSVAPKPSAVSGSVGNQISLAPVPASLGHVATTASGPAAVLGSQLAAPAPDLSSFRGTLPSQGQQLQVHSAPSIAAASDAGQQTALSSSSGIKEDVEADPQKRLQATLQLAAALLQQIQQQVKS